MSSQRSSDVWQSFVRCIPVGLAVFPVSLLFGLVAARSGWSSLEIVLLSCLGFTGSGQFALVKLQEQMVPWYLILLIILLINLRYVPMLFTVSRGLKGGMWRRSLLAHFVSDESFALERPQHDTPTTRAAIRLIIATFWVLASLLSAVLATRLPEEVMETLGRLTFPASALLILLGLLRVRWFIDHFRGTGLLAVAAAAAVSVLAYLLLGGRYFWLPSIIAGSLCMYWISYRRTA